MITNVHNEFIRREVRFGFTRLAALTTLVAVSISLAIPVNLIGNESRARGAASGDGSVTDDSIEARVTYDDAGDRSGCTWSPVTGVDPISGSTREMPTTRRMNGVDETLYERSCGTSHSLHWVRNDTTTRMAAHSQSRMSRLIPRLVFTTAPPADKMVVNVGTWFWVRKSLWRPVSVTAVIPTQAGPITVTTTATPTHLIYSPGDGSSPVTCRGPGIAWRRSYGDRARSNCMHTYRVASHTTSSHTYKARLSIQWAVTWTSNLGIGGRLPNVRLGLGSTVRVLELQALSR